MRGDDTQQASLISYVSIESRIPQRHPLRSIRALVDQALAELSDAFAELYSPTGRRSIAPEKLLRALLLQVLYSIRSERMLMEELDYNLLYRWFVGLSMDDPVWDVTTFSKNRERLINTQVARDFFNQIKDQAGKAGYLSDEHFSVDGTLIEAWASTKSFRPRDGSGDPPSGGSRNPEVDFHKQTRANDTHASTTDPDARLHRKGKGKEAKLSYMGHALMENRNGLVVDSRLTCASGTAERDAALEMASELPGRHPVTLGADKGYDTQDFVKSLRVLRVTPHVAQNTTNRRSAIDGRTTRHAGYVISQRKRKRIEEVFGWIKTVGTMRKTRFIGQQRVEWAFTFALAAYNLVRMRKLAEI
ncbi:IS5 family transposase [Magnetofaba australis]|uniref:Putative transposase n=1 Tax=Magnetofaba australis IT-1 TaxID=1434232 RepID=A0A1Y2K8Y2_9PROT|nr:IS5 family transposase [Magnetofaba australis]OSM07183.1 putative transposase [Magnetofaba australis IT-1]